MSRLGPTLQIVGEVRASEDLTVEGRISGPIMCEGGAVTLAASADVNGNILARDITVYGKVDGQLVATEIVDVRPDATVSGDIIAKHFVLNEGASFRGRVEPQHLEAAIRVARYGQKMRDLTR